MLKTGMLHRMLTRRSLSAAHVCIFSAVATILTISISGACTVPSYTLRYFDARGSAEVSRLLFAIAKTPYKDVRYPCSFEIPGDFSTICRNEFDRDRSAGKMTVSLGKVPVLDIGSGPDMVSIPQSAAIERYLANEFGMMGQNSVEAALIDATVEHIRDIRDAYASRVRAAGQDEMKKAAVRMRWFDEEFPETLAKIDDSLAKTSRREGCCVGKLLSLADIVMYHLFEDGLHLAGKTKEQMYEAAADAPLALQVVDRVAENVRVQDWLQKRPETSL